MAKIMEVASKRGDGRSMGYEVSSLAALLFDVVAGGVTTAVGGAFVDSSSDSGVENIVVFP